MVGKNNSDLVSMMNQVDLYINAIDNDLKNGVGAINPTNLQNCIKILVSFGGNVQEINKMFALYVNNRQAEGGLFTFDDEKRYCKKIVKMILDEATVLKLKVEDKKTA